MIKIYLISLILIIPLFFFEKKMSKNLRMYYIFFIFLLIMGFRDNATISVLNLRQSDEYNYRMFFEKLVNSKINLSNAKSFEIGNYMVTWLMANIFKFSQSWIFLYSFITNYLFLRFIKIYIKPFWLGVFLYVTVGLYTFQINAIRSILAASILTLVVKPFIEENTKKVFLITLVAASFHFSAWIMFFIYFFRKVFFLKKGVFFWLVLSFGVMLNFKKIVNIILIKTPYAYYLHRINSSNAYGVNMYRVGIFVILYILILFFYKKIKNQTKEDIFFEKCLKILLFFEIVSLSYVYVHRFNDLLYFSLIYLIPRILNTFEKKNKRILTIILVISFFIFGLQQNYGILCENILIRSLII
ncbi:MAG: EpsG family protein [Fusobacterium sp.]